MEFGYSVLFPDLSRNHVILRIILCGLLVTIGAAEGDFLPFILSNATCTIPRYFTPMCACTSKLNITDFSGFCGSHEELVDCLETEVAMDATSMMSQHFNKTLTLEKLQYLCRIYSEIKPKLESCTYRDYAEQCDNIPKSLQTQNFTLNKAMICRFSNDYSTCYWHAQCPPKVRHFLASVVTFYTSHTCAKHGTAISERCYTLGETLFPDKKKIYKQCINFVHLMKNCFLRERIHLSEHPQDVIHNMEFNIDKFEQYRMFHCDIDSERNHECNAKKLKQQKACFNKLKADIEHQVDRVKNRTQVTAPDLCRIYDEATQCVSDLFINTCPVESVNLNSIMCASMPSSCHCPVDLTRERLARASDASQATRSLLTMSIVQLCSSVMLWNMSLM